MSGQMAFDPITVNHLYNIRLWCDLWKLEMQEMTGKCES